MEDINIKQMIMDYVDTNHLIDPINWENSIQHDFVKFIFDIDSTQIDPQLAQYLAENHDDFIGLMREYIVDKLTEMRQKKTAVWLAIKPTHLANIVYTNGILENRLSSLVDAKIVSLSVERRSVIAAKYVCKKCVNQSYDEWLIKGFNEISGSIVGANLFCCNCGENLREDKHKRSYVSKRYAIIKLGNDKRSQTVEICCDLFQKENSVYIGAHFDSVVIVNANRIVISLEKTMPIIETRFSQIVSRLPYKIRQLYYDRKVSSYSFGMSLSYIFCETVSANGTYFRLKLGLILSLISCNDVQKIYSSILAVSGDTTMVRRLMEFASGFSKSRFVSKSPSLPIIGSSRKESNDIWIDGGPILLSSDGICVIFDIMSFPEKEKIYLNQAMENNEVVVRLPPPNINPFQCALRSSIWAVIEDRTQTRNQMGLNTKLRKKTMSLVNTFPMVYVVDDEPLLETQSEQTLTIDEWQAFFDLLKQIPTPDITNDSQYLINGYYIGIRKFRGFNCKINAMSTLISLAKSFAKLNLRSCVDKDDALIAILLYEESLTYQFGYSPLTVKPVSHVTEESEMCAAIGPHFDSTMKEFETKLIKFIEENTKADDPLLSQLISQRNREE